jgi:hypothetical protein
MVETILALLLATLGVAYFLLAQKVNMMEAYVEYLREGASDSLKDSIRIHKRIDNQTRAIVGMEKDIKHIETTLKDNNLHTRIKL